MFRGKHFWRPPHYPPPSMPFGPGMIKEMSQLVFLWTISEESEGITGYDLQKNYHTKQTNVYRALKEMEDEGFLASEETIESGRAQKLYRITEKGREYLKNLREKWTYRVAFLTDIVPAENFPIQPHQHPPSPNFMAFVNELNDKEEAEILLSDMKNRFLHRKNSLEQRLERLERYLREIEEAKVKIEAIDKVESDKIREILKQLFIRNRP